MPPGEIKVCHLTHILRCAENLSELSDPAQPACQAEVHDLYVSRRRQAGEENVLWLREKQGVTVG